MTIVLDITLAESLAAIALGHVGREYPNQISHGFDGPQDAQVPSQLHPIFYGSYDWHSCVHGYWTLARLLRLYPGMVHAEAIRRLFDTMLTDGKVAGECAYFDRPSARGYQRPYGWAWLLKLSTELHGHENGLWSETLSPLTQRIVQRFNDFLPIATYPVRVGTHFNTAFALRLATDYAETTADTHLFDLLQETALRWYGTDHDCTAWGEPSGDDFLSSTLIEAECMRRLMPAKDFADWFDRFLPDLDRQEPAVLFSPARVSDRSDGKIAHLDGLNISRAWCWRSLAVVLPADDARRPLLLTAADTHLAAGLGHVAGDYMGEHWLASYVMLALTETPA